MKIDVFAADSTAASADSAFDAWLAAHPAPPDFVALHQSVPSRAMEIERRLSGVAALHGATSCLGVMNQDGPHISDGFGAFAIWDADGDYGTGLRALGDDSRSAAFWQALKASLGPTCQSWAAAPLTTPLKDIGRYLTPQARKPMA